MKLDPFKICICGSVTAITIPQIIRENKKLNHSERAGRLIDNNKHDSMETKKKVGYF